MSNIHTPKYQKLLKALRQARIDAGLSQEGAAKKLGKLQSYISKIELGERRADFIEVIELAKLYRKPLRYFEP